MNAQATDRGLRVVALAVVHGQAGRVLLVRSAKRAERWELPGGEVEAGESPMDACRREVREETGVELGELTLTGLYYGSGDGLLRITFSAGLRDSSPSPVVETSSSATRKYAAEILEVSWFDPSDLPRPMPVLARRMIAAWRANHSELATVQDDSELS